MNKLKKLKLSEMSKSELQAREMNKLLGGANCCTCSCAGSSITYDNGDANNSSEAGYGISSYA